MAIVAGKAAQTLRRVVIERVSPEVDEGRFAAKRTVGDLVRVTADIFADGHEQIGAVLRYRTAEEKGDWREEEMKLAENDRWEGQFRVDLLGKYFFTLAGWVDEFKTWATDFGKRVTAGQDVSMDVRIGLEILESAARRAGERDKQDLQEAAARLSRGASDPKSVAEFVMGAELICLVNRNRDRTSDTEYGRELAIVVDPEKARFSAWYEMFPRSCTRDPKRPGRLRDTGERVAYAAAMGFDVLYLPPIHPIGVTERKGKNNSLTPAAGDVGSPWAIGGKAGGHKEIHPELGTLEDLRDMLRRARDLGMDVAMDLAYQCSPDHPYVREHREWFRERPDGTVQYAENPPKKYQDIYPFDFATKNATELWEELKSVVMYWADKGVRIFRMDNPHTKPFAFWEWLIVEVKREYPDVIFLSEAFTRPKVMYQLAKLGFTQSYTYFAWKNTKAELTEYFTETTSGPAREFFRGNLWPNTPDILNAYLQNGGRPAFAARFVLAATLGANYGIYGPAFELHENRPIREGSEEYLDSEKYEVRVWDTNRPDSLRELITRVNAIRRTSPALQQDWSLKFHPTDNEQLIAYSKTSEDFADRILVVVNLDPHNVQTGWVSLDTKQLKLGVDESYQVHDLLADASYTWKGSRNFVKLEPWVTPGHVFRVRAIR